MNKNSFLIISFVVLFFSACKTSAPTPKPIIEELNTSKAVKIAPVEKPKLYEQVFINCFNTGKVATTKSCKQEIIDFLDTHKGFQTVVVEVHTDKGGKASRNLSISKKRAYKIASDLKSLLKNLPIYYAGLGEQELIIDELTKEANVKNRRIEIQLLMDQAQVDTKRLTLYKKVHFTRVKKVKKSTVIPKKKPKITHVDNRYKNVKNNPLIFKSASLVNKEIQINKLIGDAMNPLYKEKIMHTCSNDNVIMMERRNTRGVGGSAFIKNMDGGKWSAEVDNYTIVINPLFLFKDGSLSERNPKVKIYKNGFKKHSFSTTANAYLTQRGVLYRLFTNSNDSIQCIDMLLPYDESQKHYGFLYFVEDGRLKEVVFEPYITE